MSKQDRLAGDEAITLHGTLAGKWSFESLIDPCGPSETDRLVAQAVHVCLDISNPGATSRKSAQRCVKPSATHSATHHATLYFCKVFCSDQRWRLAPFKEC